MKKFILKKASSKITLKIKSFHYKIFNKAIDKILKKMDALYVKNYTIIALPIKIQRFIVLRSPHIDKKSREHFEIKHHFRLLTIDYNAVNLNEIIRLKYLINYIKNLCTGCQIKITYLNK